MPVKLWYKYAICKLKLVLPLLFDMHTNYSKINDVMSLNVSRQYEPCSGNRSLLHLCDP